MTATEEFLYWLECIPDVSILDQGHNYHIASIEVRTPVSLLDLTYIPKDKQVQIYERRTKLSDGNNLSLPMNKFIFFFGQYLNDVRQGLSRLFSECIDFTYVGGTDE